MKKDNIPESKIIWEEGGLEERVRKLEIRASAAGAPSSPLYENSLLMLIQDTFRQLYAAICRAFQEFVRRLRENYLRLDATNGPMTGDLDMGGNRIVGLGDPENDQDAATKKYVDDNVGGGGGGGASTLDELEDVSVPAPEDKQVLTYDETTGQWIAADAPAGGAGVPGGEIGSFQVNDNGEFGGTGGLYWDLENGNVLLLDDLEIIFLEEPAKCLWVLDNNYSTVLMLCSLGQLYVKEFSTERFLFPSVASGDPAVGMAYFDDAEGALYIYSSEGWVKFNGTLQ